MDHDSLISQVSDHPEYSYRGMMIDPAITYLPPSFFEHLFDGMVSGFALLCMAVVWCPMFGTVKATGQGTVPPTGVQYCCLSTITLSLC
jgi:hypothetical protein